MPQHDGEDIGVMVPAQGNSRQLVVAHSADESDRGAAMMTVLSVMVVVMAFSLLTMTFAVRTIQPARKSQDSKAAMAAAHAGIADLQSRLTASNGNVDAVRNDATNGALDTTPADAACTGAGTQLRAADGKGGRFCYRLLPTNADGTISAVITGFAGVSTSREAAQTLTATYKMGVSTGSSGSFFGYLSMYELVNPNISAEKTGPLTATTFPKASDCLVYRWAHPNVRTRAGQGGSSIESLCQERESRWQRDEVIDGPAVFNDSILQGEPDGDSSVLPRAVKLTGPVRYTWPDTSTEPFSHYTVGSNTPQVPISPAPVRETGGQVQVASTITGLRDKASPDLNGTQRFGAVGCLYRGATQIIFEGDKMRVDSPNTTVFGTGCPNSKTTAMKIPPLIYVAPAATCTKRVPGFPKTTTVAGDTNLARFYAPTGNYNNNAETVVAGRVTDYDPCRGNAMVEGWVQGTATSVAAEHDIVVVNNIIVPVKTGTDAVGLMAEHNVWVHNPVFQGASMRFRTDKRNPVGGWHTQGMIDRVDAAILAAQGSFTVQNFNQGDNWIGTSGTTYNTCVPLYINGSVAQRYAGRFHISDYGCTYGYTRRMKFDTRFATAGPPFMLGASAPGAPALGGTGGAADSWTVIAVTDTPTR